MKRLIQGLLPLLALLALAANGVSPARAAEATASPGTSLEEGGWYRPPVEFDSIKYIVITARRFLDDFQPLVRWKTRKGVPADAVAVEDILDNTCYRGTDGPETLRNFIADLYWKWGLDWVLLGGDVNIVPARMVPIGEDGNQAADLYYSALDGSWNTNSDAVYGDTDDRTDLVEEVFVGRVPVENAEEIEGWLKKYFTYIKPRHRDYQMRALLVGAILGSDARWDADDHYKDIKADAFEPAGFEVSELEESENLRGDVEEWKDKEGKPFESAYIFGKPNGRVGPSDLKHFLEYMNRGTGVVSHIIHSNVYLMGLGHGWITKEHVIKLTNEERPCVIFSSGCQVNMFNMESISEHMVLWPKGGAVAFIGCTVNSYAHQNKFERDFWEALFFHDIHRIGQTLAASKARRNQTTQNVSSSPITILNRGLNLLGDPEMSIWTKTPADLAVKTPSELPIGESELEVKVYSGTEPLREARVCLWKEGEHHVSALTDKDGKARLLVRCRFPGAALFTVTAHNHVPFETEVRCGGTRARGAVADIAVADGAEGFLDAGEKADVPLVLWNSGSAPLTGATVRVTSVEGKVDIVQGEAKFPDVTPGAGAVSEKHITLRARPDAPPGHRALVRIELKDGAGSTLKDCIPIYVNASWVVRLGQALDDRKSDGDGRLTLDDCGKTVDLYVELGNQGSGTARKVLATLSVKARGVQVGNSSIAAGDLPVGARVRLAEPFKLTIGDEWDGAALECELTLASGSGTPRTEEFYIEEPFEPPEELRAQGRVDSVHLRWTPLESAERPIAGYNVYRARAAAGPWKRVNPTLLPASAFEDRGLEEISEYYYRVTSLDRSLNESAPTQPIKARTVYGQQRDWPKEVNGSVSELVVGDLDGDGDLEIATGDSEGPWIWHHTGREVHHGGDYWTFGLFRRSGPSTAPVFADIDGSGSKEVVVCSHQGGRPRVEITDGVIRFIPGEGGRANLHVFDMEGKDVKGWPKNLGTSAPVPPQVADLDGDGKPEIIALTKDGKIHAFKPDGSKFGSDPLAKIAKDPQAPFALADLDADGDLEIVGVAGDGKLYAFHHDGKAVAGLSFDAKCGKEGSSCTAVGDLDGDGRPEIVVCGGEGKQVFALHADGKPVPGFPAPIDAGKEWTVEPVLADLDGDGRPEVLVGGEDKVTVLKADGKPLAGFPVSLGSGCMGIAVGDVDGDGRPEVVAAGNRGVHAFDADGKALRGWPLVSPEMQRFTVRTVPLVADVDLDGDVEVLVGAGDRVLIFDLPAQFEPGGVEWAGYTGGPRAHGAWKAPVAPPGAPSASGTDAPGLSWPASEGAVGYLVYRGEESGPMGLVTPVPLSVASFSDKGATGGARFRYAVCAVGESGRSSRFSPVAEWEDARPETKLKEGESKAKAGDVKGAAEVLRGLTREFPRSRFVERARKALAGLGPAAGGQTGWDEAVRRMIVVGDLWAKAGLKRQARMSYLRAIEANPDGPSAEEARVRLSKLGS